MNIKELKKELGISDKEIAEFFELKTVQAYRSSSAKKRYDNALCSFYAFCKKASAKAKEKIN